MSGDVLLSTYLGACYVELDASHNVIIRKQSLKIGEPDLIITVTHVDRMIDALARTLHHRGVVEDLAHLFKRLLRGNAIESREQAEALTIEARDKALGVAAWGGTEDQAWALMLTLL